jgi:outer membrane protein assembly factor BamA
MRQWWWVLLALALQARSQPVGEAAARPGDWTEWRVRHISCLGLQHTDSTVILRELELSTGFGYSDELLADDARAVKNTNLFARLVVSVNPDSAEEAVDIVFAVNERPRWLAYPILSPTDGLGWTWGGGLMNRNLGGMGRRLDLAVEAGRRFSYSVYLQDPWFMGRRQAVSLYHNRRQARSAAGDYDWVGSELRVGWQQRLDRHTRLGLHPFRQEVVVHDRRAGREQVTVNPRGVDAYGGLSLSLDRNTTDFHVSPGRGGHAWAMATGLGLGGDNQPQGLLVQASASRFAPLGPRLTVGLNLSAGLAQGRLAEYMKHYLGGRGRVRSGAGGQWPGWSLCHGSFELRAPLLPRQVYFQHIDFGLGWVAFLDGGLVWEEQFHGRRLAAGGAGLGLRLFAPFVEVGRIDAGWSPTHGFNVHIAQGHAF